MNTKTIHVDANTEIGIVSHEGKEFSAFGYTRTPDTLVAYLHADKTLTTWDGLTIGRYRVVSTWSTPRSYVSSTMSQIEGTLLDGSKWTGRSAGVGMVYKARPISPKGKR
jgi:hypothetical protein